MNIRTLLHSLAAVGLVCSSSGATAGPDSGDTWTANGATACAKYLTPDVLAAILSSPAGPAERLDTDLCRTGSIYIHLTVANVEVFKQEVPRIIYAHPFSGVGDAAFWNPAGAFSSVKRPNRGCDISVIGPPPKIHEEALARKVGEICNKLFALP